MKIRIDVDVSPEELREFLGLPPVKPLQEELMQRLRERLEAGEGVDPVALMGPLLAPNLEGLQNMQRAFWDAFSSSAKSGAAAEDPPSGR